MLGQVKAGLVVSAIFAIAATGAKAAYFDDFESYDAGSVIQGQGDFIYWLNVTDPSSDGLVSDAVAYDSTKSLMIGGHDGAHTTDPVWQFADVLTGVSPVNSGEWINTQMLYIPDTSTTGFSEWNYMNSHPFPTGYGGAVRFNLGGANAGKITGNGISVPADIVYNQWIEFRMELNFSDPFVGKAQYFYNDVAIGDPFDWNAQFAGIDYYANAPAGPVYVDDVSLSPKPTKPPADFNDDGNVDIIDINKLTSSANLVIGLPAALAGPEYDLTDDGMVDLADLDQWLIDAATINGFGSPYLKGDANLDGDVDVFQIDGSGDAQVLTSHLGTIAGAVWGEGDFNGDGDVDVFAIDGSGDAQVLTSNLGSSSDATAGTAEAIYNAVTGELTFDVGKSVAVIGVQAEGLDHGAVDMGSNLGVPAQNGGGILAYFNASGLPAGTADVGAVLPTGLTADAIGFSYTPIGGDSTVVPVTVVVPEPSTFAMLGILPLIGIGVFRWSRRSKSRIAL